MNKIKINKIEEGYSFTIITGGHRNDRLNALIQSINRMTIPRYEIIVTGKYKKRPDIVYNHKPEWALEAQVCKMRNLNCKTAKYDKILILDDDVEFTSSWYNDIKDFIDFDMTGCHGIDPEGNRWFDYNWASRTDPLLQPRLMPYNEYNNSVYISGYFMMFKQYVWEKVKFDESRKNYQYDDVDFCHRVIDAGFRISVFPKATVIHYLDKRGRRASEKAREEFIERNTPEEEQAYQKGLKMIREGEWGDTVEYFEKIITIRDGARENYQLGLAYKNMGHLEEAERLFQRALSLFSSDKKVEGINLSSLHFHLGEIYEKKGELSNAENEYKNTLNLLPSHRKAFQALERIKDR